LPRGAALFDQSKEILNLIANAETLDIGITWSRDNRRHAGFVGRLPTKRGVRRDRSSPPPKLDARELPSVVMGEAIIWLNEVQTWSTTYEVLLHELAHVLLGHLKGWSTLRNRSAYIPRRAHLPVRAMEVEACAVSYLVSRGRWEALAFKPWLHKTEVQLKLQFLIAFLRRELPHVDLLQVATVADILFAWCDEPPEGAAISRFTADGPRPSSGRLAELELSGYLDNLAPDERRWLIGRGLGRISELDTEEQRDRVEGR